MGKLCGSLDDYSEFTGPASPLCLRTGALKLRFLFRARSINENFSITIKVIPNKELYSDANLFELMDLGTCNEIFDGIPIISENELNESVHGNPSSSIQCPWLMNFVSC